MVGNLGEVKKNRTKKNSNGQLELEDAFLPITVEQLNKMNNDKKDDISLDYEQYLKVLIQNDERGKKKKNQSHKVYPEKKSKPVNPLHIDQKMVKAQRFRTRLNSYANRNVKKSKFEFGREDKQDENQKKDMKFKGRPSVSDYGIEV